MKSPITGKEMEYKIRTEELEFRREKFSFTFHYYYCEDSKEEFTDEQQETINLTQIYDQYRQRHSIPTPSEIAYIRTYNGASLSDMDNLLGIYSGHYAELEKGMVPEITVARLLNLLVDNPKNFQLLKNI